jgi:DNA (cytosine-5)-methyltransferase 1
LRAELETHLRERGYPRLHFNELRAEDAGTPSHRLRLFLSNVPLELRPSPKPPIVREALSGLPPPGNFPANHLPHPLTADKLERLQAVKPGGALYGYRAATGKSHANWQRLKADELAPTVQGNSRFIHPTEDRLLTPREHARLMGFPDGFVLKGGRDQQYDAIGEAVPPPLARSIAEVLRSGTPRP